MISQDLFAQVDLDYIKASVSNRAEEHLHLDFRRLRIAWDSIPFQGLYSKANELDEKTKAM